MTGCRPHTGVLLFLVGFLLLVPLTAWAQQPKPGGTLRVAWEADVAGMDPRLSPGAQAGYIMGNLFNSLVSIDAELNYVPDLAKSWEILEDGKVYVFHLRQGVKFHDGTDFDAKAVQWNYQRMIDPAEKALDAPSYSLVDGVEVVDTHTVKFILKYPSATLLPVMAAHAFGFLQMSPASYKRWGKEEVRLHPVGTGPFKLANWEQNRVIVLEKNPHYFKPGLPYLDRIEFRIIKEGVTRVTALRTGEVDFANAVPYREGMDMHGKAAIFHTPKGRMDIYDVRLPAVEPDGILVRITRANICGSDLHIWRGDTPLRPGKHIIGHEMVGRVAELGSNIQSESQGQPLAVGDRVTFLYFYFCGRCYACLEGYRSACVNMMRHPYQMDDVMISMGAYAEYYYLRPGHYVFKVPEDLSDEMVAPVNCALAQVTYGLQRIGLRIGQSIVIQGAGGLGIYATAVARDMGAAKIIVIDRFEPRLQMAAAFGADHLINLETYDREESRVRLVRELTNGWGVDVCVEVVGSPSVIPEGIRMLKNGGHYLIMGSINPKQTAPLEAGRIVFGRITLMALATYEPWVIPQALDFMRRNLQRYPFQKLISHTFPLTGINEAFQQADAGAVIRASLVP